MEQGTDLSTWLAYGAICLFLLVLVLVVLRSAMFFGSLVVMPIMQWFRRERDAAESAQSTKESDQP